MKKLILVLAFVFASGSFANTNNNNGNVFFLDCTDDAWDYGTANGGGNELEEYIETDAYFDLFCNDDGSYNDWRLFLFLF